jgi:hypothetical protein
MAVPYTFGTATAAIPLSQLDSNFSTTITLGNTAIQLGNSVSTLNNMTLANVTISSGNVTITNVSVTNISATLANVTTANVTNFISGNVSITGGTIDNVTIGGTTVGNVSANNVTISNNLTLSGGTANGVTYLNGSKVLTSGSALVFDGTNLSVGTTALSGGKFSALADLTAVNGLVVRDSATTYANNDNYVLLQNSTGATAGGLTHPASQSLGIWGFDDIRFVQGSGATEQMRLTSTGLGIGTSSPAEKLHVVGKIAVSGTNPSIRQTVQNAYLDLCGGTTVGTDPSIQIAGSTTTSDANKIFYNSNTHLFRTTSGGTTYATIDTSGNLGLGVTPSAWGSSVKAIQIGARTGVWNISGNSYFSTNTYFDGTNSKYIANSFAIMYSQQDDGAHKFYTAPSGTAGNTITFTQAMTLDASGNLGIGTTSPAQKLDVYLGTTGTVGQYLRNTTINLLSKIVGTTAAQFGTETSHPLTFITSNTERACIDSSGNVGIGTTSPDSKLVVIGNAVKIYDSSSSNANLRLRNSTTGDAAGFGLQQDGVNTLFYNNSNGYMAFATNATERMRIDSSGNLLVGTTSSAGTLATNVQPVVAGIFRSATATVNVNNNTAGTLFTLPDRTSNISTYIVSATINSPSASAANYSAYAIICVQNTTAKIMTQVNGALMTITLSGLNVQVTQSSGGNQDCVGTVTRVA